MSNPTWDDENCIPGAICSDCGADTIIRFSIKPSYPKCDGFCDCCGCPWVKGNRGESKTPDIWDEKDVIVLDYFKPTLTLVSSQKEVKSEVPDLKNSIANIFPADYNECNICGYDHKYDAAPAARKHQL